jgi:hypothetical protein
MSAGSNPVNANLPVAQPVSVATTPTPTPNSAGTFLDMAKRNGWMSVLMAGVMAFMGSAGSWLWDMGSWFKQQAGPIIATHVEAVQCLEKNYGDLVESDKKKTEILGRMADEQSKHSQRLDMHGMKIDHVITILNSKPGGGGGKDTESDDGNK